MKLHEAGARGGLFHPAGRSAGLSLAFAAVVATACGEAPGHRSREDPLASRPAPAAPLPPQQPPSTSEDWLAGVRREIAASEYELRPSADGLQAANRAHGMRSYFGPTGVRVVDRSVEEVPLVALELRGIGRGDSLESSGPGSVHPSGRRVEIRRPELVEWYENSPAGLEQGFTLPSAPPGRGALILEIEVAGASASLAEDSVLLAADTGRRLDYSKLEVFAADGSSVPARFEVPGPDRIRLAIADDGARYPLIVDPVLGVLGGPELTGENNSGPFGISVAGAGDGRAGVARAPARCARPWRDRRRTRARCGPRRR